MYLLGTLTEFLADLGNSMWMILARSNVEVPDHIWECSKGNSMPSILRWLTCGTLGHIAVFLPQQQTLPHAAQTVTPHFGSVFLTKRGSEEVWVSQSLVSTTC